MAADFASKYAFAFESSDSSSDEDDNHQLLTTTTILNSTKPKAEIKSIHVTSEDSK